MMAPMLQLAMTLLKSNLEQWVKKSTKRLLSVIAMELGTGSAVSAMLDLSR